MSNRIKLGKVTWLGAASEILKYPEVFERLLISGEKQAPIEPEILGGKWRLNLVIELDQPDNNIVGEGTFDGRGHSAWGEAEIRAMVEGGPANEPVLPFERHPLFNALMRYAKQYCIDTGEDQEIQYLCVANRFVLLAVRYHPERINDMIGFIGSFARKIRKNLD